LIYSDAPRNLPKILFDRMRDRTVLCCSASKAYAMTGWRCGWTIAPKAVVDACNDIQGHATSNVASISQKATIAALTGPQDCVASMREEYRRRRDLLWPLLVGGGRFRCVKPEGAFYLFVDVTDVLSPTGIRTSAAFAKGLLDEARVALTAGEGFDAPGFVRISYATSEQQLREAVARMERFVAAVDQGRTATTAQS
jgi:aspartate aminotransferase